MSWQIPPQIEQDIISGKAVYQTHQVGYGGQSVLSVKPNSYIVVFGYDFSPAGNGLSYNGVIDLTQRDWALPFQMAFFGTQQIGFYNGNDFFPFLHNIPISFVDYFTPADPEFITRTWTPQCEPIARQLYITSNKNLAITVGLVLQGNQVQTNATPVTGSTPFALTYGGSGQLNNAELELNLAGTRNYIQPQIPTDNYGFAPISPDNSDQLYWFPDTTYGIIDPMLHIQNQWTNVDDAGNLALANYKLCLHYALYSATVPETRG
jgi:hypothetical protein